MPSPIIVMKIALRGHTSKIVCQPSALLEPWSKHPKHINMPLHDFMWMKRTAICLFLRNKLSKKKKKVALKLYQEAKESHHVFII